MFAVFHLIIAWLHEVFSPICLLITVGHNEFQHLSTICHFLLYFPQGLTVVDTFLLNFISMCYWIDVFLHGIPLISTTCHLDTVFFHVVYIHFNSFLFESDILTLLLSDFISWSIKHHVLQIQTFFIIFLFYYLFLSQLIDSSLQKYDRGY